MKVTRFDILWCVFFAALSTGYLATVFDVNPILIGALDGIFGTVVAYILLRIYDKKKKNDEDVMIPSANDEE